MQRGLAACTLALLFAACGDPKADPIDANIQDRDASTGSCEPPEEMCTSGCTNTTRDAYNCGRCDNACPPSSFCSNGECARLCSGGLMACGQSCIDPATDRAHCGMCNRACPADRDCRGGSCVCPTGYTECRGVCVNTDMDTANCGICERVCRTDQVCNRGSCECAGGMRETSCSDTKDNDCDGVADCMDSDCAGTTRSCNGACGAGIETCNGNGTFTACSGGDGSQEICGDGIDQDCVGGDQRNPDAYEPNDDCATCVMVTGLDPSGFIDARFDSIDDGVDCYAFNAEDNSAYPEHIRLGLENIPSGQDYDLYLYENRAACDARTPLTSSQNGGSANESIDWSERFGTNDDGTFYILVIRFSGWSCDQNYHLTINGLN
jgi:hypothetical protein